MTKKNSETTILVVDDNVEIRLLVSIALTEEGYTVLEACSSEECLRILSLKSIDIILSDVMMPGTDGIETFKKHIHGNFKVGVIFMSAHADIAIAVDAVKHGALDFVEKPFEVRKLLATVAAVVKKQQALLHTLGSAGLPKANDQVNNYRIESVVGEGASAVVYKATQKSLDRIVALKVLLPQCTADPTFAARFEREARICATLSHPGIIAVFDYGNQNRLFYLAMEYIDGATLSTCIKQERLPIPVAIALGVKICAALAYAHSLGIVHRDIKPHNILVSNSGTIKLADFGLARCLDDVSMEITQSGLITGTPLYMAPELVKGETCSQAADIFSLGSLLYLLLTGTYAFSGSTSVAVMNAIAKGDHVPALSKNRKIGRRLNKVLEECLFRDPVKRPTAIELGLALAEQIKIKSVVDIDRVLYDYFRKFPFQSTSPDGIIDLRGRTIPVLVG